MKKVLAFVAAAEAITGLIVIVWPSVCVHLLFAEEASGPGIGMSRLAGVALIGLGIACWPGKSAVQQLYGMFAYSTLALLYLIHIGFRGIAVGVLLWPAVVAHAILSVLLARALFKKATSPPS